MKEYASTIMVRYLLFSTLLLLVACSDVCDARIDAYRSAASRVKASSSYDEIALVSYNLYKELVLLDASSVPLATLRERAAQGCDDSRMLVDAIDEARKVYENELVKKEMERYVSKSGSRKPSRR